MNPRWDPFYADIYDLAASYLASEALNVSVGKIKAHYFSQEYNTRNRDAIVFEIAFSWALWSRSSLQPHG